MDREEFDNYLAQLMTIETRIKASDMAGILNRWESGKILVEISKSHKGSRQKLADMVGINTKELEARVDVAMRCKTKASMERIAKEYGSWNGITTAFLMGRSIEEARAIKNNNRGGMAQIGRGGRGRATLTIEIPEELTRDLLDAGYPAKTAMKDFVNSITADDVIGRIQKEEAS